MIPTRRFKKARVGGREESRDRHLDGKEIVMLAEKLPNSGLLPKYQYTIWLILATACRVNEILRSGSININKQERTLKIPRKHAKNKKDHVIYLSDFALDQILLLEKDTQSKWLLASKSKKDEKERPLTRQAMTKQITDRQKKRQVKGRSKDCKALILPGGKWTPHDLRRTASTIMQQLGVAPHVIKKCLNQKPRDKLEETYQRAELIAEQKDAFEKLGEYLYMTINTQPKL